MVASCGLALVLRDALRTFELLLQFGAGTGLVMMLRWYWWRINAAAEIAAVVVSAAVAVTFFIWAEAAPETAPLAWMQLLVGVGVTTLCWFVTALVTHPTAPAVLDDFYARVRPAGPGWGPVAARVAHPKTAEITAAGRCLGLTPLLATIASTAAIWAALFAMGNMLYGQTTMAALLAAVAAAGAIVVARCWPRLEFR